MYTRIAFAMKMAHSTCNPPSKRDTKIINIANTVVLWLAHHISLEIITNRMCFKNKIINLNLRK